MYKLFKQILVVLGGFLAVLFFAGVSYASTLSVRLAQPKSPNNQNNFNLTFVVLDTSATPTPITAKCFKEGPGEGSFTQFGPDIAISAGGNSANCADVPSVVNTNGTYSFYVSATNGSETQTSSTVSVDYNTNGPGTPGNYSKEHPTSCEYLIKFRTADDGGKTSKVELYRSTNTSFSADNGTRVQSMGIASNTDGTFTDNVGDCSKTYYYAIRAFDNAGNGSGVVGDSETHITNPTTTTQASGSTNQPTNTAGSGAIPVVTSSVTRGSSEEVTPQPTTDQNVLGASVAPTKSPAQKTSGGLFSATNMLGGLAGIIILGVLFWLWRRRKN